jgi:hypothetical protein
MQITAGRRGNRDHSEKYGRGRHPCHRWHLNKIEQHLPTCRSEQVSRITPYTHTITSIKGIPVGLEAHRPLFHALVTMRSTSKKIYLDRHRRRMPAGCSGRASPRTEEGRTARLNADSSERGRARRGHPTDTDDGRHPRARYAALKSFVSGCCSVAAEVHRGDEKREEARPTGMCLPE